MDVFSLLKFWRHAGIGDPINPNDFDDESSFFDLVFTNPNNLNDNEHYFPNSTPHTVFINSKRKILPLDTSSSKPTPKSPFRRVFQTKKVKDLKCEIEEVTISSLLHRDNSLRHKLKSENLLEHHDITNEHVTSKRFSKEVVSKYLNLIKTFNKKSNEKSRLTDKDYSPLTGFVVSPIKEEKQLGKTVFKEVKKHLGKSRSSSSSNVKHVPLRRDDSALQQHDGIQSAILHCKKSYNSPSQGCIVLSRSGSAPSHGHRISVDEEKRSSI